jgi:hypothetical protein
MKNLEDSLTQYDYLAFQVYWNLKNLKQKSPQEQQFLRSFFSKYQILVISEAAYTRDDQISRIQHIVKNTPDLTLTGNTISEIRSNTMALFNTDLRVLTGLPQEQFPMDARNVNLAETSGMFAMNGGTGVTEEMKLLTVKAVQNDFRQRTESERKQLLQSEAQRQNTEFVSSEQFIRIQSERMYALLNQFTADTSTALNLQLESMENRIVVTETKTQLDNNSLVEQVEATKAVQHDIRRLINQTQMGQSWENIPLKDMPKWLKSKCVAGLKRLAITTVMLPIRGPAAIINNLIVQPLQIVIEDIGYLKKWLQRVLGWTMVVFVIAGVAVFINHPDYENGRQQLKEAYGTVIDYIPVKIVSEPTRQTVSILWSRVPGQKFFLDVTDVMKGWAYAVPGLLLNWFSIVLSSLTAFMKEVIINSVKDWWQGK